MFHWYRNATRCYVYLSDVTANCIDDDLHSQWDSNLGRSRWFARGWTLQELLAPRSIEFFSYERIRIGDRSSLIKQIQQITGVPTSALQGACLSQFSVDERFLWIERRQTKLAEDKVYSLLGILDVEIPLYYGEGAANASKRVREVINRRERCVQDLRLTDPRDDKKRIEDTKGGLLKDSYSWILENSNFQQWRDSQQNHQLLWIKGDPGKGKTMLLCGVIDELKRAEIGLLSYFFCQATDSRINNATAVLRGLLYLLVSQQPSLVSHILKKYDHAGKALFEDANAWIALSEIFTDVLGDSSLNSTILIIDALDECIVELPKLLNFIVQKSSLSSRVKWIVSSRNWPDIEKRLERAGHMKLCLELNTEPVSTAVDIYIQRKVNHLTQQNDYSHEMQQIVLDHLSLHANDTFLWVALVCQDLENVPKRNIQKRLAAYPLGLDSLYKKMIERTWNLDDADHCKRVLATTALVSQPITLKELTSLTDIPDMSIDELKEIIRFCGSFLTIHEGTGVIYFVHQSARDFLMKEAFNEIFPSGEGEAHYYILSRSLQVMSKTLRRDIYGLDMLGYPVDEVKQPDPNPLGAARYSCMYWIDHLCNWNPSSSENCHVVLQDGGAVNSFLRQKFLYWLEALSLCKSMSKGLVSITALEVLIQGRPDISALNELVHDARRFIMSYKWVIEKSPLQAYASALLFSPTHSLIRGLFKREELDWITIKPGMRAKWSPCLQTLEGHSHLVHSVAFSPDSTQLASGLNDDTIKIWDASSGDCLQTLEGHSGSVRSVAYSPDSTRLASGSRDKTVKIWDARSGDCLQTLEGHSRPVQSIAFSPDSKRLASGSKDNTVKIWDVSSGNCLQTLEDYSDWVRSMAFSPDSTRLASGSDSKTVKIWDMSSGDCIETLEDHIDWAESMAFSPDLTWLALGSDDGTVKQGLRLSSDGLWITYNSENLLWLPSEYRPSCSIVSKNVIGIGTGHGRVWICRTNTS